MPASSRTWRMSSLLVGATIRARTRWQNTSSPLAHPRSQHPVAALKAGQVAHPRGGIGSGPPLVSRQAVRRIRITARKPRADAGTRIYIKES